jgi:hypothetical protein
MVEEPDFRAKGRHPRFKRFFEKSDLFHEHLAWKQTLTITMYNLILDLETGENIPLQYITPESTWHLHNQVLFVLIWHCFAIFSVSESCNSLTNSMVQRQSLEIDSCSGAEETARFLWYQKIHYRVHSSSRMDLSPKNLNAIHASNLLILFYKMFLEKFILVQLAKNYLFCNTTIHNCVHRSMQLHSVLS